MKRLIILLLIATTLPVSIHASFSFRNGKNMNYTINSNEQQVVNTAFEMFRQDFNSVFDAELMKSERSGDLIIGTIGLKSQAEALLSKEDVKGLSQHEEAFLIKVLGNKLVVLGSDKRGTAYGILELSRMIGVSPWVWWGDSPIAKKESLVFEDGYRNLQYPSVSRRGIFINDEDWGLTPWSYQTYEPSDVKGQIGPKTHARIFELLLRLRANTFWPAMHSCSVAFYNTPGNKEMADKYGIFVGTSHCEPMMRNTNAEWKHFGEGSYNYSTNRENVLKFWEQRVKELTNSDNIYTLGMRGIHDGPMEGAKTTSEQKDALTKIFKDQREMLARIVNPDLNRVSQVFIPYKEVFDAYKMGLEVPEDITLMWTDDNYGYIRHFPDSIERARKGGNGIYYHISYWGRPHDYLWLATNHPAQIYSQMKLAYDKGAKDMWIINVGDIKPAEYLTELFLDMSWNIHSIENNKDGLNRHLYAWLSREFGATNAKELLLVMNEYYRLAYIRKPEFMGNTRTEEKDPEFNNVSDLPWSESYIRKRIKDYEAISEKVKFLSKNIDSDKQFSWFQLIEYPVCGATEMNKKHLYGQLARHGLADWQQSDAAYDEIVSLTQKYNTQNNGKWNKMMDFKPRNLSVFDKIIHTSSATPLTNELPYLVVLNGSEYFSFNGPIPVQHGLGYHSKAINLIKGSSVIYKFESSSTDSIIIEISLAPNHPVDGNQIRYTISLNGGSEQVIEYSTKGRSEEWKENVLRNQAIRRASYKISNKGIQKIKIEALDECVIIDQIRIMRYFKIND